MVGLGGHLQASGPGRHQADRVAGEHRQVLGVQEERRGHQVGRAASGRVGEQQVAAVQRGDGDGAAGGQRCKRGNYRFIIWNIQQDKLINRDFSQIFNHKK